MRARCGRCKENPVDVEVLGAPEQSLCAECIIKENGTPDEGAQERKDP